MNKIDCALGYFEWEDPRLINFTLVNAEPTPEDIRDYQQGFIKAADSVGGKFIMMFDGTVGKWMGSAERIEFGKVAKELEASYGEVHLKSFIVVPNPVVMMLLKGVNLVSKPKIPQEVFKTRAQADEATAKHLASM